MPPFRPFSELADPNISRRRLPHWECSGATYFITFRLADALPVGAVQRIEEACKTWLRAHGLQHRREINALPVEQQREFRQLIARHQERWLDASHGRCVLRDPNCREILSATLRSLDGQRYILDAFVIMPNHVHVLVQPLIGGPDIAAGWKKYSARRINQRLQESGRLWQVESFDHIVRDWDHLERFRRYIQDNPTKAKLPDEEYFIGCGMGVSREIAE